MCFVSFSPADVNNNANIQWSSAIKNNYFVWWPEEFHGEDYGTLKDNAVDRADSSSSGALSLLSPALTLSAAMTAMLALIAF